MNKKQIFNKIIQLLLQSLWNVFTRNVLTHGLDGDHSLHFFHGGISSSKPGPQSLSALLVPPALNNPLSAPFLASTSSVRSASSASGLADASSVESSDVRVASSVSSVSADADLVALDSGSEAFASALSFFLLATVQPSLDTANALLGSLAFSPPSKESASAAFVPEAFLDLVASGAFACGLTSFTSVTAVEPSLNSATAFGFSLALVPPLQ